MSSGELAGLGGHMSSGSLLEPGRSRLWGGPWDTWAAVSHSKGSRGAGSSQVPGCAASWLCGLGQVTHPP